jgi:hypothetical protein
MSQQFAAYLPIQYICYASSCSGFFVRVARCLNAYARQQRLMHEVRRDSLMLKTE